MSDWAEAAIARLDGSAATGDLSNKNEAFEKEFNKRYNQWIAGQYTAANSDKVSITADQLKQMHGEIIRDLEHEWVESCTSWSAAGLPASDGGTSSAHPTSPSGSGSSSAAAAGVADGDDEMDGYDESQYYEYEAAYMMPMRGSGESRTVLLSREERGGETKLCFIGANRAEEDGGWDDGCAKATVVRGAQEATEDRLPESIRHSIDDEEDGRSTWYYCKHAKALVVTLELDDDEASDFPLATQQASSSTEQCRLQWVNIGDVNDSDWRNRDMHADAIAICEEVDRIQADADGAELGEDEIASAHPDDEEEEEEDEVEEGGEEEDSEQEGGEEEGGEEEDSEEEGGEEEGGEEGDSEQEDSEEEDSEEEDSGQEDSEEEGGEEEDSEEEDSGDDDFEVPDDEIDDDAEAAEAAAAAAAAHARVDRRNGVPAMREGAGRNVRQRRQ